MNYVDTLCQLMEPYGSTLVAKDDEIRKDLNARGVTTVVRDFDKEKECPKCGREEGECWFGMWPPRLNTEWFLLVDVMENIPPRRIDYAFKQLIAHVRYGGLLVIKGDKERDIGWWTRKVTNHYKEVRNFPVDADTAVIFVRNTY